MNINKIIKAFDELEVHFNVPDGASDEETEGQGGPLICPRCTATVEPEPAQNAAGP